MRNVNNGNYRDNTILKKFLQQASSVNSRAIGLTHKVAKKVADFYQKHPKKVIAGGVLSGVVAVTGISQDMRIVHEPYANVVEDFLNNQKPPEWY